MRLVVVCVIFYVLAVLFDLIVNVIEKKPADHQKDRIRCLKYDH